MSGLYYLAHAVIGARTKHPELWDLGPEEVARLVEADKRLLAHIPAELLERSQLALDISAVIGVHVEIYSRHRAVARAAGRPAANGSAGLPLIRPVAAPPGSPRLDA